MFVRTLVLLVALVASSASALAQTAPEELLIGSWSADFRAMLAAEPLDDEERALAEAMLGNASMVLRFDADGSVNMNGSMMGQTQTETGTWSAVGATGHVLTIVVTTQAPGGTPESERMVVTFNGPERLWMADDSGESIPFNRVSASPAAQLDQLPNGVVVALLQTTGTSDSCDSSAFAHVDYEPVDVNLDGAFDYIVHDPCNAGANDGDIYLMLADQDAYRSVLVHYGEALTSTITTTNGFAEMRGSYCDGWADCTETYFRWNGSTYERYREVRDQRFGD